MRIDIIDPTIDSRWEQFIKEQKHSTIFHTSAWAKVIKSTHGFSPRYYILENENGQFQAAIPTYYIKSRLTGNRLICLPFSDNCFPILNNEDDILVLLNTINNDISSKMASYLEIRGWQNKRSTNTYNLKISNQFLLHVLDIRQGTEILEKNFSRSIRQGISQARKRGVSVRMSHSEADLKFFYKLYLSTRKKHGVIPQPYRFFKSIYNYIISQNLGFLAMADYEGTTISGGLFFCHKDTIYYKYNASNKHFLNKRPNNLIIWEVLQYACRSGYKYLNFGRSTFEQDGLRSFKCMWGAEEIAIPYYYYPSIKGCTVISGKSLKYRAMNLFSHIMPESIFRLAGLLLCKHLS